MRAHYNLNMLKKDEPVKQEFPVRPLRAPKELPRPVLKQVHIILRPPVHTWIQDDSRKATALLDGLASYLRSRDAT